MRPSGLSVLLLGISLLACQPDAPAPPSSPAPTVIATEITAPAAATQTQTPEPSSTPTPAQIVHPTGTPTEAPTQTAEPSPTAPLATTVLLEVQWYGGDGIDLYWQFGTHRTELLLYRDGHLILQEGEQIYAGLGGPWFSEAWLSAEEMCALLAVLDDFHFFDEQAPVYADMDALSDTDGLGSLSVRVMGDEEHHRWLNVKRDDLWNLSEDFAAAIDFLLSYQPADRVAYRPEVMSVAVLSESSPYLTPEFSKVPLETWRATLPSLAEHETVNTDRGLEQWTLSGDTAQVIFNVLGSRLGWHAYREEGIRYYVSPQIPLPHMQFDGSSWQNMATYYDVPVSLPFACP